jgi:integrase
MKTTARENGTVPFSGSSSAAACGLRRAELVSLVVDKIQMRDERWVIRKRPPVAVWTGM